jgi:hypothetical protein
VLFELLVGWGTQGGPDGLGTAWHGVVQPGAARHGAVRRGMESARRGTAGIGPVWFGGGSKHESRGAHASRLPSNRKGRAT